ncbi:GspE/PulE family protein [Vibrio genomosp. F10]|nr:ATPase, T2SS/T4P/T4SS family [Vibrio genomosp. F10]
MLKNNDSKTLESDIQKVNSLKELSSYLELEFVDSIGTADLTNNSTLVSVMTDDETIVINEAGTIFTCDLENHRISEYLGICKEVFKNVPVLKVTSPAEIESFRNIKLEGHIESTELTENEENLAAEILTDMLTYANAKGASDIHIRLGKDGLQYQLRENGHLISHTERNESYSRGRQALIYVCYKAKDSLNGQNDLSKILNGAFENTIEDEKFRLRVSFQPLYEGFKTDFNSTEATIRLLRPVSEQVETLEDLNIPSHLIRALERSILLKNGAILIGGPTGSGKTALAHAILNLVKEGRKINTLEDPVEIINPRYRHSEVYPDNPDANMVKNLKNMLRQDGDVVLVGEIRDEITATTAAQVALNGHLLISTLHVSAVEEIYSYLTRFLNLKPIQVSNPSFSTLWMCQRLASTTCSHCSIQYSDEPDSMRKSIAKDVATTHNFQPELVRFRNELGCEHCSTKGALGLSSRLPVIEYIEIDSGCRKFIQDEDIQGLRKYLLNNNWQPMANHAAHLIKQGLLDPEIATQEVGAIGSTSGEFTVKYFSHEEESLNGTFDQKYLPQKN